MNRVKDHPKVCSVMNEDKYLSNSNKKILGTLRNSVIFHNDITLVSDLGKKICRWSYDQWLALGDISKYKYFIDEQRNALYPYKKIDNQYKVAKINLNDCEISDIQLTDILDLPKCESKKKSRSKSKRRIASNKKSKR